METPPDPSVTAAFYVSCYAAKSGGIAKSGTNVVFFNGGADIWGALSVLTNRSSHNGRAEVTSFLVPEQKHCQDKHKDPNDPPQLVEARRLTNELIGEWLL
ncbi:hypothetical protein AAVH_17106 [Aphelenchoides avenae]|nr:hypothetical protein AAVH_17106 [Aphelenchus avenae]